MAIDTNSEILVRFPGPVTLNRSRRRWLLVLLGGALFTIAAVWLVMRGDPGGWFVGIFFGLCTVCAFVMLLPGAGSLKLDAEGFEIINMFRSGRTRWQDASGFQVVTVPPIFTKVVGYDATATPNSAIKRLNTALSGRNGALPETYGLNVNTLADLMTKWRELACRPR